MLFSLNAVTGEKELMSLHAQKVSHISFEDVTESVIILISVLSTDFWLGETDAYYLHSVKSLSCFGNIFLCSLLMKCRAPSFL